MMNMNESLQSALGKELKLMMTTGVQARVDIMDVTMVTSLFFEWIKKRPVDMYIFDAVGKFLRMRGHGYPLLDKCQMEVEDFVCTEGKIEIGSDFPRVWIKIDDYGDEGFVATVLLPEEY